MRAGPIVTLAAGLLSAGCATRSFDQHFEAGRLAEAVAEFDADPELHGEERALFRAGVARSILDSPAFEPDSARAHFARLLSLYPGTAYRETVNSLTALLEERERLTSEIGHLRAEAERTGVVVGQLSEEVETLRARERQLRGELATVRGQLESLKEIDLRGPGTPASVAPPPRTAPAEGR